jgi:ABC-2 type transport system ATP-binding protein
MRQRVKLAQSLVHDPDLLFLDEPTNGLDPKGRREMLELIRELAHVKGIHVVLSSHLLRDVEEVCHSVVVLQGGKLVRHEQLSTLSRGAPDACAVRIAGDPRGLPQGLREPRAAGHRRQGARARDQADAGGRTAPVFAAAKESGAIVRMLRPVRITLEDALIDVLGRSP